MPTAPLIVMAFVVMLVLALVTTRNETTAWSVAPLLVALFAIALSATRGQ